MAEISVIIVSWNASGYLRQCLTSLQKFGGETIHEVIVVDNASSDDSPDMVEKDFPEVKLVRSRENLGFARANNIGIKMASGSVLALINSDVVVHQNCFQQLVALIANEPAVGLVGPKIFGRDGKLQRSCGRFPTVWNTICGFFAIDRLFPNQEFFSGFEGRDKDHEIQRDAEVLSGCFWVARHEAVKKIGGLDEGFFFYAEDVDWCKRFRDGGWKIVFFPDATATHFGGGSSSNAPFRYSIEMLRSNLIYWKKHHGWSGRAAYYTLALGQHFVRLFLRGSLRLVGLANDSVSKHKITEHWICIRWLLTGKGV